MAATAASTRSETSRGGVAVRHDGLMPVQRQTVQDRVYAELRRALICGLFQPGQVLTIQELARSLNTSTMPVREALGRLISEQALEPLANRSVRVPLVSSERIDDLLQARVTIECAALERAVPRLGASDLARLCALTDDYDAALRQHEHGQLTVEIELNQAFHFLIYRASGSSVLIPIIESLWLQSGPYVHAAALLYSAQSTIKATHYHREIISAIEAGDIATAKRALASDIGRAFDLLRDAAINEERQDG